MVGHTAQIMMEYGKILVQELIYSIDTLYCLGWNK